MMIRSLIHFMVLISVIFFLFHHQVNAQHNNQTSNSSTTCDYFQGTWVLANSSYPLYDPTLCPFIQKEFNCRKNGRSDELYLHYRWQPHACDLPKFDGGEFLRKFKGKIILFVGDSLSRNQWKSMGVAVMHALYLGTSDQLHPNYFTSTFYVHIYYLVRESEGRILKLDSIEGSKLWKGTDMLIFNTWHWWNRRGSTQPWDYIEEGGQLYKDMDRTVAFGKALNTWAKWIDTNIDPSKTKVFFKGISPSHYNGTIWNEPSTKTCTGQKEPVPGSNYPGGLPPALNVLKEVLSTIKKPVVLLDITNLSLLRKVGHPSIFGLVGRTGADCSHWCLPGVPDTWNHILYNLVM